MSIKIKKNRRTKHMVGET